MSVAIEDRGKLSPGRTGVSSQLTPASSLRPSDALLIAGTASPRKKPSCRYWTSPRGRLVVHLEDERGSGSVLRQLTTGELLRLSPPLVHEMVTKHNPYVAQASTERLEYLRAIVAFNKKLVPAFAAAGIPVLAGTDTPVPGMVAGFGLHDEMEAMARYGLSNRLVLEGATRLPAEWLGTAADRGVVALGKRADLLLLDANPMEDVANTRKISAVIGGGRFLTRAELSERMTELKERYTREGR